MDLVIFANGLGKFQICAQHLSHLSSHIILFPSPLTVNFYFAYHFPPSNTKSIFGFQWPIHFLQFAFAQHRCGGCLMIDG
jgi:hypothetical protein